MRKIDVSRAIEQSPTTPNDFKYLRGVTGLGMGYALLYLAGRWCRWTVCQRGHTKNLHKGVDGGWEVGYNKIVR